MPLTVNFTLLNVQLFIQNLIAQAKLLHGANDVVHVCEQFATKNKEKEENTNSCVEVTSSDNAADRHSQKLDCGAHHH
jgi:hypothetical protein